jgi:Zn-dependent oligopeptidase
MKTTLKERLNYAKDELRQDGNRSVYSVITEAITEIKRLEEKHDTLTLLNLVMKLEEENQHCYDIINAYGRFEGEVGDSLHKTTDSRLQQAFENLSESLDELGELNENKTK